MNREEIAEYITNNLTVSIDEQQSDINTIKIGVTIKLEGEVISDDDVVLEGYLNT